MAYPVNEPCPCGSGRKYKRCCGPFHDGAPAPTAEALMRSRYSAYAVGRADYILATTHPDSPHREADREQWLASVRAFHAATTFLGLTVRHAGADEVSFEARLLQGGREVHLRERSRFHRVGERWLYHSGTALPP